MKKLFNSRLLIVAVALLLSIFMVNLASANVVYADNTSYYVDSVNGNDNNTGQSPDQAFQTLNAIDSRTFEPGDKILLKVGSVFNDQTLTLQGSGTSDAPITVDAYADDGSTGAAALAEGARPQINTEGLTTNGVSMINESYWNINSIEVTNTGATQTADATNGVKRCGISIEGSDHAPLYGIHIDNVYVHDVNGDKLMGGNNGGIIMWINDSSDDYSTHFIGASVTNSTIENVSRTGITIGAGAHDDLYYGTNGVISPDLMNEYFMQNVEISHNLVENVNGDGILPQFSYEPLIEYNVVQGAGQSGKDNYPNQYYAGVWPWRCYGALFQYNEVSGTVGQYNGDGMAYDCDYSQNTVFQYNYSHDNGGGFMLFCKSESLGSVVRYNVSVNDQRAIIIASNTNPAHFYNNTIYNTLNTPLVDNYSGKVTLQNNIFAYPNSPSAKTIFANTSSFTAQNNNYVGLSSTANKSVISKFDTKATYDTLANTFVNPGFDGAGLDGVRGYALTPTAKAVGTGLSIWQDPSNPTEDPVNQNTISPALPLDDFFGTAINPSAIDQGAVSSASATASSTVSSSVPVAK